MFKPFTNKLSETTITVFYIIFGSSQFKDIFLHDSWDALYCVEHQHPMRTLPVVNLQTWAAEPMYSTVEKWRCILYDNWGSG